MSLFGLMRILGHHDVKMTLRYAAVSPETLREQYYNAIDKIEQKYKVHQHSLITPARLPEIKEEQTLRDLALKLKKYGPNDTPAKKRKLDLLLKRIYKLDSEIKEYL